MSQRSILHVDINNCYASIEILHHPKLHGHPVAVGGDVSARHGIILAKDYIAKKHGVQVGQALWEAKQLCPNLIIVPPNYDLYLRVSRLLRNIFLDYTDQVEPFGLDEAWLDVTGSKLLGTGEEIAEEIRERVKKELGISVSIGVSFNKIFAKLGSDMKKPDAITVITKENYQEIVWPLPAQDLLGVGSATKKKLYSMGVSTIGDIAGLSPKLLQRRLHKWGLILHSFANGLDQSPVEIAGEERIISSIGNSITAPRDLIDKQDSKIVFMDLSESVAERLRDLGLSCKTVQISLRDNNLLRFERQLKLETPSNLAYDICHTAMQLVDKNYSFTRPLRSIGVRAMDLIPDNSNLQLSFYSADVEKRKKMESIERTMDWLRGRFGHHSVERGIMLSDPVLGKLNPKADHVIHPVGYF